MNHAVSDVSTPTGFASGQAASEPAVSDPGKLLCKRTLSFPVVYDVNVNVCLFFCLLVCLFCLFVCLYGLFVCLFVEYSKKSC